MLARKYREAFFGLYDRFVYGALAFGEYADRKSGRQGFGRILKRAHHRILGSRSYYFEKPAEPGQHWAAEHFLQREEKHAPRIKIFKRGEHYHRIDEAGMVRA